MTYEARRRGVTSGQVADIARYLEQSEPMPLAQVL